MIFEKQVYYAYFLRHSNLKKAIAKLHFFVSLSIFYFHDPFEYKYTVCRCKSNKLSHKIIKKNSINLYSWKLYSGRFH